ncbi:hypothetical protein D030_0822B, partial [Vibrio parahaemolyticus AQ3810]
TPT